VRSGDYAAWLAGNGKAGRGPAGRGA